MNNLSDMTYHNDHECTVFDRSANYHDYRLFQVFLRSRLTVAFPASPSCFASASGTAGIPPGVQSADPCCTEAPPAASTAGLSSPVVPPEKYSNRQGDCPCSLVVRASARGAGGRGSIPGHFTQKT